jgi:hypothetical protein
VRANYKILLEKESKSVEHLRLVGKEEKNFHGMSLDVYDEVKLELSLCGSLVDLMRKTDDDLSQEIVQGVCHVLDEKLSKVNALLNRKEEENPS